VGLPLAVAARWIPISIIPLLLLTAAGCALVLQRVCHVRLRDLLRAGALRAGWGKMLAIYCLAVVALWVALWWFKPDALFSLLLRHPRIWLLVMFAYPLISVLPQELIYRAYFFERYRPLFGRGNLMVAMSAAVFALGHVVFHNAISVVLTLMGGWLFARTYQRTSSLLRVSVEHALYGCAIFTLGYGQFFLEGTLRLFK